MGRMHCTFDNRLAISGCVGMLNRRVRHAFPGGVLRSAFYVCVVHPKRSGNLDQQPSYKARHGAANMLSKGWHQHLCAFVLAAIQAAAVVRTVRSMLLKMEPGCF